MKLFSMVSEIGAMDVIMATVGMLIVSVIRQRRAGKKGPVIWPVLGIIPTVFINLDNIYDWATDVLRRCGGTFPYHGASFCGAHGVVTSDPSNVEYMLKTNFANFPKGRYYRERFVDFLGDGIFNADGEVWKEQRRAATFEMHSSRFLAFSAKTITELVHGKLLRLLEGFGGRGSSGGGQSFDLQDILLRFTFDNISSAAFGVDTGCLEVVGGELPEIPFAKAFEEATELTLFRFIVPPFVWRVMKVLNVGSEKKLRGAIKKVHEFADKTVRDRRLEFNKFGGLKERFDILSRLVEAKEGEEHSGAAAGDDDRKFRFSEKFIKDFCISFILAGRDTSSVALTWFFWLLERNPRVESNILEELHGIIKLRDNQTSEDEVVFSVEELKKMNYLQAALSEGLRLYPSVPIDFKEVMTDDVLPDGSPVRSGGRVMYSIYSMARMEEIWGKDCTEFVPERWLKNGGRFSGESHFKYAVFNAGPRLCVGKNFAYMQMKTVASAVILRYSVRAVEGQEICPKLTTTLYMKNGLKVKFIPRKK